MKFNSKNQKHAAGAQGPTPVIMSHEDTVRHIIDQQRLRMMKSDNFDYKSVAQ